MDILLVLLGAALASPTGSLNEQLLQAAEHGAVTKVDALLNSGADPSYAGLGAISALIHAAVNGFAPVAQSLLAAGARVNHRTKDGETALLWAVGGPHFETTRLLIAAGADLSVADKTGSGVYHRLAYDGRRRFEEMVVLLLAAPGGDEALARAKEVQLGETPLLMACRRRKWKVAAAFLETPSANANATTKTGVTAAMWSANALNVNIVRTLVQSPMHRANVDARDANGKTALWYARSSLETCRKSRCALLPSDADADELVALLTPSKSMLSWLTSLKTSGSGSIAALLLLLGVALALLVWLLRVAWRGGEPYRAGQANAAAGPPPKPKRKHRSE